MATLSEGMYVTYYWLSNISRGYNSVLNTFLWTWWPLTDHSPQSDKPRYIRNTGMGCPYSKTGIHYKQKIYNAFFWAVQPWSKLTHYGSRREHRLTPPPRTELANKSVEHGMATFMDSIFEVHVRKLWPYLYCLIFPTPGKFRTKFWIVFSKSTSETMAVFILLNLPHPRKVSDKTLA
jgi:hypothetical protein